jgi:hypothetical protein
MSFNFLNQGQSGTTGGVQQFTPIDTFIDPVSKIRVSNPSNLIDTDFEYGLQPTKWETVELINNTPAFFSKGGDTTIPDITGITTNAGTREITVITAFDHNLAVGIPIRVAGTKSVTADGSYIINATPTPKTFTYLCRANQPETISIFDLYSSIITGEFFQGSQISISAAEGITTDADGPVSLLTVKTENKHGFGRNTPFYFLNLNSTISQEFESQNDSSLSFDPSNSATAQTFDGSNTLLQTPIDLSNSATTSSFQNNIFSSDPVNSTFTLNLNQDDRVNWESLPLGSPLYYSVNAQGGYFQENPRGVVFLKTAISEEDLNQNTAIFQVSLTPDGDFQPLLANTTGFFQIANLARTFAGNNVNQETQVSVSVIKDEPLDFDGGNRGYAGELPEGSDPPITSFSVVGYTEDAISVFGSQGSADFYPGTMVLYNTTSNPATGLTNNTTYFVTEFSDGPAPGFYVIKIAEMPNEDPIEGISGGSGTQTFSKIAASIDKNIVHIKNAGFQKEDMIEYSNGGVASVQFSTQKDFYFVEDAYDSHNFRLGSEAFRPTVATGGVVSETSIDGRHYRIHTFTDVGDSTFTVTSVGTNPELEYLIVAGGGGGGMDMGGGGGGGGVVSGKISTLDPGTYNVKVGFGGAGAPRGTAYTDSTPAGSTQPTQGRSSHPFEIQARNGGDSKFGKPITKVKIWDDDFDTNTSSQYIANNFQNSSGAFTWETANSRIYAGTSNQEFAIRANPSNFLAPMQQALHVRSDYLGASDNDWSGLMIRATNGQNFLLGVTSDGYEDGIYQRNSLTSTSGTLLDRGWWNHASQSPHLFEAFYENNVMTFYVDGFLSAMYPLPGITIETFGIASLGMSPAGRWDNLEAWTWNDTETVTAWGGGGGGISNSGNRRFGRRGGSGGGPSGYDTPTGQGGTEGIRGQGNRGGHALNRYYAGGGGGAGAQGGGRNSNIHGVGGGVGIRNDILGTPYYWGGGGGASGYSYWGGNGGPGGGGAGAAAAYAVGGDGLNPGRTGANGEPFSVTYGGDYSASSNQDRRGGDGGANTGGGGGGGGHYNGKNKGGDGGSGIVIVRYPYLKTRAHAVPVATGGNIVKNIKIDGKNYRIHAFTSSGTFTIENEANRDIEYLLVGGGGGGGMDMGGGGGAGGYLSGTKMFVQGSYQVSVGAGGFRAPGRGEAGEGIYAGQTQPTAHAYTIPAQNGQNTTVSGPGVNIVAFGGGAGGTSYRSRPLHRGSMGASGGGCSGYDTNTGNGVSNSAPANSNAPSQGSRGGRAGGNYYSGGGGGAGGPGWDGNNRADGGGGRINGILGLPYYWAGGGGGGGYTRDGGRGGVGGGGGGAIGEGLRGFLGINDGQNGGGGGTSRQANTPGGNGGANTGGGGGGGAHIAGRGGQGGTGIVVFRYSTDQGVGLMKDVKDLVVSLDASNTDSYPGSGTTWTNTAVDSNANRGRVFPLTNVSYSSLAGGSLQFNGATNSYVRYNNFYSGNTVTSAVLAGQTPPENNADGNLTYEVWARPTVLDGNARHLFTDGGENEGELDLFNNRVRAYWQGNSFAQWNTSLAVNQWYHFVVTHLKDSISGVYTLRLYVDGVLRADSSLPLPGSSTNWTSDSGIQSEGSGYGPDGQLDIGFRFAGQISMFRIYGDSMMSDWVEDRFNMHRARFGK